MDESIEYFVSGVHSWATREAVAFVNEQRLADGVAEIVAKMREWLPSMVEVRLVVEKDPECDCDPELVLRAIFPSAVSDETLDAELDRFDEAWWLDASGRWDYQIEVQAGSIGQE